MSNSKHDIMHPERLRQKLGAWWMTGQFPRAGARFVPLAKGQGPSPKNTFPLPSPIDSVLLGVMSLISVYRDSRDRFFRRITQKKDARRRKRRRGKEKRGKVRTSRDLERIGVELEPKYSTHHFPIFDSREDRISGIHSQ